MTVLRWTSQDLEALADKNDGRRYEVIDGELYVSSAPHYNHQAVAFQLGTLLKLWNKTSASGKVNLTPGIIFSDDDNVIPDLIWISNNRLANAIHADGKLHLAPELVVEVLSPGNDNESRDREVKRKLYSRRGVSEYWVISWPQRLLEVYRRDPDGTVLELVQTLYETDTLKSPLLPGFSCNVGEIFEDVIA